MNRYLQLLRCRILSRSSRIDPADQKTYKAHAERIEIDIREDHKKMEYANKVRHFERFHVWEL